MKDLNELDQMLMDELEKTIDRANRIRIMEYVAKGADIHLANAIGETALHYIATLNQPGDVALLIEGGADVNCLNNYGETPITIASIWRAPISAKELLDAGANLGLERAIDNDHDVGYKITALIKNKLERDVSIERGVSLSESFELRR